MHAGRLEEIHRARAVLRDHPVLLVEGLSGAGKTAFLEQLAAALGTSRRPLALRCGSGWTVGALPSELIGALGGLPGEGTPPSAREAQPLEAALDRLVELVEGRAIALFLDDYHRLGGEGAAIFVERLMSGLARSRAVIASSRRIHLSFPYELDCPRIVLRGLWSDEAAALVASVFEQRGSPPPDRAWIDDLHARTAGHPLALKRAVARALERAAGGPDPPEPPAPEEPDPAIASAVEELPEAARRLLRALSLARVPLPPAALEAVAGGPSALAGALSPIEDRFLVETAAGGRLILHPLVLPCVAPGAAGAEGDRRLHTALAEAFARAASRDDPSPAVEAVHHLVEAGEVERARAELLRIVADLRRAGLWRAALALADRLARALGRPDPEVLLVRADLVLRYGGRGEDAEAVSALASLADRPALRPAIRLAQGRHAHLQERLEEAAALLEESARGFAEIGDPGGSAEALAQAAHVAARAGRPAEGVERARRALELAERAGDRDRTAQALRGLAMAHFYARELPEAARVSARALEIDEAEGHRGGAVRDLSQLAWIELKLGRRDAAIRACERGLEHARAGDDEVGRGLLLQALGQAHFHAGRPDLALPRLEEASRCLEGRSAVSGELALRFDLADCRAALGEFEAAESGLRAVQNAFAALGNEYRAHSVSTGIARCLTLAGRPAEALELLDGLRGFFAHYPPESRGLFLVQRSLALAALGRLKEARRDALEAAGLFRRCELAGRVARAEIGLGAIACRLGRFEEVRRRAREALGRLSSGDADPTARIAAWRLIETAEDRRGARRAAEAARKSWSSLFIAAPSFVQLHVERFLGLYKVPFPEDHSIRTGLDERSATLPEVARLRRDPGAFDLVIDAPLDRLFRRGAGWIDLSRRRLLLKLASYVSARPGVPLAPETIFRAVWGASPYDAKALRRVVDFNVRRLRRILKGDPREAALLTSASGAYVFAAGVSVCTIEARPERGRIPSELNARQETILRWLRTGGEITPRECARRLGTSTPTAYRDLAGLLAAGLVARRGRGRGTSYRLAEAPDEVDPAGPAPAR